jgi:hypothetical protein
MAGASFKITGFRQVQRELYAVGKKFPGIALNGLFRVGEKKIMRPSKKTFTPVKWGNLRATGKVIADKKMLLIRLTFGGPVDNWRGPNRPKNSSVNYADYQHKTPGLHHKVGGELFLQKPLLAEAPNLARDVAAECRMKVGKPSQWTEPGTPREEGGGE